MTRTLPRPVATRQTSRPVPNRFVPRPAPEQIYIRPLLSRTHSYVVPTTTLAAYIASQLVREQFDYAVAKAVQWALAMFDVTPVSGGRASKTPEQIGDQVESLIEDKVGEYEADLKLALDTVMNTLLPVYGRQVRVTGWMPGHRVAEGRTALELSGNPCPSCTVNPTAYRVGDRRNVARCLNSEDCGWTSA